MRLLTAHFHESQVFRLSPVGITFMRLTDRLRWQDKELLPLKWSLSCWAYWYAIMRRYLILSSSALARIIHCSFPLFGGSRAWQQKAGTCCSVCDNATKLRLSACILEYRGSYWPISITSRGSFISNGKSHCSFELSRTKSHAPLRRHINKVL